MDLKLTSRTPKRKADNPLYCAALKWTSEEISTDQCWVSFDILAELDLAGFAFVLITLTV